MLFPTLNFAWFFLLIFPLSWLLRKYHNLRLCFLVGISYFFYAFWDWRFMGLLLASTMINYWGGALIHKNRENPLLAKRIIGIVVGLDLLILSLFKYFNFFTENINNLMLEMGFQAPLPYIYIIIPVGISFFTFHGISYVVDLYRRELDEPASFLQMMLYISFFPQLVAGPIVRAAHFLPQLRKTVDPNNIPLLRALLLIVFGLFKKVILANYLATDLADEVFRDPSQYGTIDLMLGIYAYALQIYCDFSAYTDIAIGLAALLGYRFPQNFNQPYRSAGVREFWQRWHISLSSWLRDYFYISLGGNKINHYRNIMLTMILGGLWHGAAWNFIIWGTLHGIALVIETAFFANYKSNKILRTFITFHFICLTWVFFRAPEFNIAIDYIVGILNFQPSQLFTPLLGFFIVIGMIAHFLPPDFLNRVEKFLSPLPPLFLGIIFGLAIFLIDILGPQGVAPFIYFQF